MKIKCIIVDDEPVARDLLKKYIADVPVLELVASCQDAFEATEILMNNDIDLLFLDINMPRLSGMSFYKSLNNPPAVIFTTAYSEYAIEGFEVSATDYLLKPFSFERFYQAVTRILESIKPVSSDKDEGTILLRADKKIHRVKLSEIVYLEGLGDYVRVHLADHSLIVHDRLKNLLEKLPASFLQIHKSYVVSLHQVKYIDGNVANLGDTEIPIGQTFKDGFLKALSEDNGKSITINKQ